MDDLFTRTQKLLDWDERIIYPEMYEKHPEIYIGPPTEVFLVQDRNRSPGSLEYIWPNRTTPDLLMLEVSVLATMYHVRIGPALFKAQNIGELISKAELMDNENGVNWVPLHTVLIVKRREWPRRLEYVSYGTYLRNFKEYELIDVSYWARPSEKNYDKTTA
jgi:hypothetical protein